MQDAMEETVWLFERRGQRLEIGRRADVPDGLTLIVCLDETPRSYAFGDERTLVRFQADMETFLLGTGWTFLEFSPERRHGRDRRGFPRLDERRRWWTDNLTTMQSMLASGSQGK